MAHSDAILKRLLALHPKIIDLSLDRMERILDALGNPQDKLPPVIHVAGTNGKGSTIANMQAMFEAAGKSVHAYTSPHLVRFHERIYLGAPGGGSLISEEDLSELLEECEVANGDAPITFFEITTAAAFLAFSRAPADYCLLEVGLGGRLDATNVIPAPALTLITPVGIDHQQYLGESIVEIAGEKAGILKRGVKCILGPQPDKVHDVIEHKAARLAAPLIVSGQDFQTYEEHGRLVYQDEKGLLDLPLPKLAGRFQIENAGTAIAAVRALQDASVGEAAIAQGITTAKWKARLQRLDAGPLFKMLPEGAELWLDGGHNQAAGHALAISLAEIEERAPKPLVLITGLLKTKDPSDYLSAFSGLAKTIVTLKIPDEENALTAEELASTASGLGFETIKASDIEDALRLAAENTDGPARVLICGSLYLAGHVLALNSGAEKSGPSGTTRT
ncbi:MAG: bifunctional folylpolyglutamate synthase/dihydrofolate synthase [Hyphomicrobiales bacterium]